MTSPFFNASYPKTYNYGHIGWVMGHELGHGFDNNGNHGRSRLRICAGVYWGPNGAYINTTWIDPTSKQGFDKMAACVVDEYNKYCLQLENQTYCVNGNQTLPENIADNGGILLHPQRSHVQASWPHIVLFWHC